MTVERGFLNPEATQHYASGYEAARLFGSAQGELERIRSQEIIGRYLPPTPARVVDVGGAGGVYSLWLLDRGYEVRLVDAMPLHVELADRTLSEHPHRDLATARLGDARTLEEPADSADALLLMGPLYHVTDCGDRLQALREAHRVLKPDGFVFAAAISRFASLLDGLARNLVDDAAFRKILEADLESGQHRNPTNRPDYFTTAFFHHPDELRAEVVEADFRVEALLAVEGPAWLLPNLAERLEDAAKREQLLSLLRTVEAEPSLIGTSAHLLAIGSKN